MGCDQSKTVVTAEGGVAKGPIELTPPIASVSAEGLAGQLIQAGGGRLQVRQLTDYQVDIIHSTWPLLSSDIAATGTSVFVDIFDEEPAVRRLFPYMANRPAEEIRSDPSLLDHATKFMMTLQCICDMLPCLDPQAPFSQSLMLLGARHATIAGFSVAYFGIFQKCLHLTWERFLREEYTVDAREVWGIIFDFGIERIRDGYLLYHEEKPPVVESADSAPEKT